MGDINESQKKVAIPYDEWDDNWECAFKREKKNGEMKRKGKNVKDTDD